MTNETKDKPVDLNEAVQWATSRLHDDAYQTPELQEARRLGHLEGQKYASQELAKAWETHNEFLRGPYTDLQKETHVLRGEVQGLESEITSLKRQNEKLNWKLLERNGIIRDYEEGIRKSGTLRAQGNESEGA